VSLPVLSLPDQRISAKASSEGWRLCLRPNRQIVALRKITMPITFDYVHNIRTEQVVFDIVGMDYPYNAIIGRGTLNAFKGILHPAYLCMKIPSDQGPITVHGSQEASRRAEGN
jgi:hypothetical protein